MSLPNEARFQGIVIADLRASGALIFNVHGHAMQASGWADLQVYHRVWTGHLELKMQAGKPRTNQVVRSRDLWRRGFPLFFLRFWNDGDVTIEVILPDHPDSKPRQVMILNDWESSGKTGNRARGQLLLKSLREVTVELTS